jgi:hypothetical protein
MDQRLAVGQVRRISTTLWLVRSRPDGSTVIVEYLDELPWIPTDDDKSFIAFILRQPLPDLADLIKMPAADLLAAPVVGRIGVWRLDGRPERSPLAHPAATS